MNTIMRRVDVVAEKKKVLQWQRKVDLLKFKILTRLK